MLNKVTEGNIEPMFNALTAVVKQYISTSKPSLELAQFAKAYAKIFTIMNIASAQHLSAILSTNCALLCALQRSIPAGDHFFSLILKELQGCFGESHPSAGDDQKKDRVKNLMNTFLHFFLFHSVTHTLLYDLITLLLQSFNESDIEVLIFILHNIGLQLRKADPVGIKNILQAAEQKRNSLSVEIKMLLADTTAD